MMAGGGGDQDQDQQAVPHLTAWLDRHADELDTASALAPELLPRLAAAGLPRIGVPAALGGSNGDVADALLAIARVAEHSLAAAFLLWSQRCYIEYLLRGESAGLVEEELDPLLAGSLAGASGLSNAIKHLAGLEPLDISAEADDAMLRLSGRLPWVTNLRPQGFRVALAARQADGSVAIASVPGDAAGLSRSADFAMMGLQATHTGALTLDAVRIAAARIIQPEGLTWLARIRPMLIGMQCGLSLGLARRAIAEAQGGGGGGRSVLADPLRDLARERDEAERRLVEGLRSGRFETSPAELFSLRIALAEIAARAVALELQALGGRAYLASSTAFARRWREAAFIPVVTPSVVQLTLALQKMAAGR